MNRPINLGTEKFNFKTEGHTAILEINNPSANTFDLESLGALPSIISQLNENREVWSLIITGHGQKFFSAGADLKLFKDGDPKVAREMADSFGKAFEAISRFRGLSIAAINGYAMGGGLECALACDLRVASHEAIMALPEASVGLAPCAGGTQNLAWLVGEGWAKRMILLGERVTAETALRIGLIEEICTAGNVLATALTMTQKAENQSPTSIATCKKLIQGSREKLPFTILPKERDDFVELFKSQDQKEGVNAFLEKRKAVWKNA